MTKRELALFDGREGRRAFVAVNGKIYDFTDSPYWKDGDHEKRHRAGCDLTRNLEEAPHVRAVIERFPVVDTLEPDNPPRPRKLVQALAIGFILLFLVLAFLLMGQ